MSIYFFTYALLKIASLLNTCSGVPILMKLHVMLTYPLCSYSGACEVSIEPGSIVYVDYDTQTAKSISVSTN